MELLGQLGTVTDEQVAEFRTKVKSNRQNIFDRISDNDKRILAFIDSLSLEELEVLKQRGKQENRSVGFHEIGTHLHTILLLTDNERYKNKE